MKRAIKLGLLVCVMFLGLTSCTMNDDDELFEPTFEESATDDHKEDADPPVEDPNG